MKIYHQTGHNKNWNFESVYDYGIGEGFIFCSFNTDSQDIAKDYGKYKKDKFINDSMLDCQFYGNKNSRGLGHFDSYEFHPALHDEDKVTDVDGIKSIFESVQFQKSKGFKKIIIPYFLVDRTKINNDINNFKTINNNIKNLRKEGEEYFLTIALDNETIKDDTLIEKLLIGLTDNNMLFDGYYIVCDPKPSFKKKISEDYKYYSNLCNLFSTLKRSGFQTIYGYSNWDSIIFYTLTDIDYITIGSFENLRNFNMTRYTQESSGGASDGWYYSEKLLNSIRAQELDPIRKKGLIDLIKNEDNIFSDIIINEGYKWSSQKPDIHKNYMLSVSNTLNELKKLDKIEDRVKYTLNLINNAVSIYEKLSSNDIRFLYASAGDHLSTWYSFIQAEYKSFI